jgi:hypothetical protein
MLKKTYGEMILKEGSILYHTSDYKFKNIPDKPMLFCTFHPSEYTGDNKYLHFIRIKKDISLLFMINNIGEIKIYSALNDLLEHPNKNLAKKHDSILEIMVEKLKEENFDGWFSSIENKANVEIALINNQNIYEVINTQYLRHNWNNGHYKGNNNEIVVIKNWGKIPISIKILPVILNINNKYKNLIKKYKEYEVNSKFISEYIFQIILDNAIINYIVNNEK